jgi:uncharacterized protein YndB with AHSA1/START domain
MEPLAREYQRLPVEPEGTPAVDEQGKGAVGCMPGESGLPPIRHCTYIDTSPQRVYETLTTGAGWDAWFTHGTDVEAHPGGKILLRWTNFGAQGYTGQDGGTILEAVAPERFVFQWTPGDSTTTVEFDLVPRSTGTVLTVTESGHTTSRRDLEALVDCAAGWGEALTLLKVYLEKGLIYGEVPESVGGT